MLRAHIAGSKITRKMFASFNVLPPNPRESFVSGEAVQFHSRGLFATTTRSILAHWSRAVPHCPIKPRKKVTLNKNRNLLATSPTLIYNISRSQQNVSIGMHINKARSDRQLSFKHFMTSIIKTCTITITVIS